MEHWGSLDIALFLIPPVLDTETVLEITVNPHLADDVTVQGQVRRRDEFDQESWCCRRISRGRNVSIQQNPHNAITTEMMTQAQNGTFPNKITTSSLKSLLWKNE
jgi:hypothetical protein